MTNIVVSDASVLINFLKIDRVDLIKSCSFDFLVPNHVKAQADELLHVWSVNHRFKLKINSFQDLLKEISTDSSFS